MFRGGRAARPAPFAFHTSRDTTGRALKKP
jgi:hypothetical protein